MLGSQNMKFELRRIIAILLLFVTINGLGISVAESIVCAGELPGDHESVNISYNHNTQQVHDSTCPSAPSQSNSTDDHYCFDDCDCPCNAPLPSRLITHSISRLFTPLVHTEQTRNIPEVYLSLFVPPDSTNV